MKTFPVGCAKCGGWSNQKPCKACGELIAAARMLLEAVNLFLENPGEDLAQHQQAVGHMRAAVAKVEGQL